jgi:iron(III) transport system ATP-binding protein
MTPVLRIEGLLFLRGNVPILDDLFLELGERETLFITGTSGIGKTTLLRLIAGLERPHAGRIIMDGAVITGPERFVEPEQRAVGMVFQGLALFPHLSVTRNVGFGLRHLPRHEREERVRAELRSVGLENLGQRYPHQLSGGQQRRVAIARSLVLRPRVLLMDEPFDGLDPDTRDRVRDEVGRILDDHGTATIIVSHDPEDARRLADRIVRLDGGRIVATPSLHVP